jgi:ribonuclease BN (tRNA processing enzyme)
VKLIFLGTKGEIEEESSTHRFHSSLLITSGNTRLMIDFGKLRANSLDKVNPTALLITHAHPDHYAWTTEKVETTIRTWVTSETHDHGRYTPPKVHIFQPGTLHRTGPFYWSGYRVIHSIRCPAVGYKIKAEGKTFIYNPDLVAIIEREQILKNVDYYIGDGSSIRANLVRRRDDQLFGHARIGTQVKWCIEAGIKHIIFTHLGKETISKEVEFTVQNPELLLAYDGMEIDI